MSKFIGADVEGSKELMGLNAGISYTLISVGPISIVPEIYYAEKGTRFTDQVRELQGMNPDDPGFDTDTDYDLEFNLAYVEIPLLAKIRLPFLSTKIIHPYLAGGPVYGFRLDCSISLTSATEQTVEDCADENFSDLKTTFHEADRGYVLVSGVDFRIPLLGTLTLDARYYRGLSRLIDDGENDDVYNQNFTLMLGYTIGF